MDSIIEQLQKHTTYTVTEIGAGEKKVNTISGYRAINSKYHEADVVKEIATADVVRLPLSLLHDHKHSFPNAAATPPTNTL